MKHHTKTIVCDLYPGPIHIKNVSISYGRIAETFSWTGLLFLIFGQDIGMYCFEI